MAVQFPFDTDFGHTFPAAYARLVQIAGTKDAMEATFVIFADASKAGRFKPVGEQIVRFAPTGPNIFQQAYNAYKAQFVPGAIDV